MTKKEIAMIEKLNIPVETLISEFERLENLEDDREELKQIIKERELDYTTVYLAGRYDEKDRWKKRIREIRDKAEVMDYYTLNDVIDDLTKIIEP